jgi:mannose-6-phosphate isomerase-like protein (cupin superfamily)
MPPDGDPMPPDGAVNLTEKFSLVDEHWSPKIVGRVNTLDVKVVRLLGDFVWHTHEDTDEFFLVHRGRLTIRLESRDDVVLGPGEFFVVPRGTRHCPVASEECEVVLLEPVGTVNTGDAADSEMTAEDEWI